MDETAALYNKARQNLVNFRTILLDCGPSEVSSAPFHYNWSQLLLSGNQNYAIEGFRESAKTQYVLRSFPLFSLVFPSASRDYIVIIKNTSTLASNKLKEIEREHQSNPLLKFNVKKIIQSSADVYDVDVFDPSTHQVVNVRIEAYGKGASIRGLAVRDRRPKIVIVDDPQDVEDMNSPTISENDWEWFLSDVMFLGQHTRIFLIGNNLGESCIIERVFNNNKQLGFQTAKVPILNPDTGLPSWPEKFTNTFIEEEKESYRSLGKIDVWTRERMCEAVTEENQIFNRNDFRYFSHVTMDRQVKDCNIYFTLDPASSKSSASCYRALVVNMVSPDNYWFIVDLPFGRWDSDQLIDILFDKVIQWRPRSVGIERGQYVQIIEPFIQKEMAKRNVFFDITPVEHARAGSKLERVKMLGPRFKAHTIWFREDTPWLSELESELMGVTREGFKSLYVDLIDALAMQEQIAQAPVRFSQGVQLPRYAEL